MLFRNLFGKKSLVSHEEGIVDFLKGKYSWKIILETCREPVLRLDSSLVEEALNRCRAYREYKSEEQEKERERERQETEQENKKMVEETKSSIETLKLLAYLNLLGLAKINERISAMSKPSPFQKERMPLRLSKLEEDYNYGFNRKKIDDDNYDFFKYKEKIKYNEYNEFYSNKIYSNKFYKL